MKLRGVSALSIALGCTSGSAPPTFGTTPMAQLTGDAGAVHVDVYSAPDPVTRGNDEFRFVVTDAAGAAPLDGLTLDVVPWMPAMGHGTSTTPIVTAEGQGKYLVTNVVIVMGGDYQLRTKISGAVTDSVTVSFSVL